ncbi:transcriptional regulator, partial [Enterococcus faecium]
MVAKLTDVAELAGVSPTTVSRIINDTGYLSKKTKQKVQETRK